MYKPVQKYQPLRSDVQAITLDDVTGPSFLQVNQRSYASLVQTATKVIDYFKRDATELYNIGTNFYNTIALTWEDFVMYHGSKHGKKHNARMNASSGWFDKKGKNKNKKVDHKSTKKYKHGKQKARKKH